MKTFLLGVCFFLVLIYIKTSSGKTTKVIRMKRSSDGNSSTETFNMFINEHGYHFSEKLYIDANKKLMIHHVPAHRNLPESHVLIDFNSNIVVTRQEGMDGKGVCHVAPRSSDEPSFDEIKKGMETVSTGKYKINEGEKLISVEWLPAGLADRSTLSKNVIDFCRGLAIYQLKQMDEDEIIVDKGVVRAKRSENPLPLCKPVDQYNYLSDCPIKTGNFQQKCKFVWRSCVHWITCTNGVIETRDEGGINCDGNHKYNQAICCDLFCPVK